MNLSRAKVNLLRLVMREKRIRFRLRNSIRRCGEETGALIIFVICAKETGRPLAQPSRMIHRDIRYSYICNILLRLCTRLVV